MTNFHVGQKVVCVDDCQNFGGGKLPEIDRGRVYTIRAVGSQDVGGLGLMVSLWVEGVVRPAHGSCDFGFRPTRFRPVVTRKTDISIFKAMLTTNKRGVPA